jgi:enterochelin esterase family protein
MHPLLERARSQGTPLIEGDTATFVWQGRQAPNLISDAAGWESAPAAPVKVDEETWKYTLRLPRDAYVEYAFLDPKTGERPPDPLNPRKGPNGLGKINHYFYMPEAQPTPLVRRAAGTRRGTLTRHKLAVGSLAVGRERTVYLYRPPVEQPFPLLVVFDAHDYVRRARLPQIVDNLIAQGRIRPIAMALAAHGGQARMIEYGCSELTLAFLSSAVLPLAQKHLNLVDFKQQPGAHAVLGASMGGLMAAYTALRLPDIFGAAISQSGAFSLRSQEFVIFDLVRHLPPPAVRLWLDVGQFEFLVGPNRRMHALLQERGYQVDYREYPGGHNYTAWRDDVWRGLEAIFPPKANPG